MNAAAAPAVLIENAAVRLGGARRDAFALSIDAFRLEPGELVACVGPSGSGKTTLLRLVAGLLRSDSGQVCILGEPWRDASDRETRARRLRTLGIVFQHFALLDAASVRDNITLPARLAPGTLTVHEARKRARLLAERLGITHTMRRRPSRASHGERQRAAICRALLLEPKLLVLDEPTSSLDDERRDDVLDLLDQEIRRTGAACLVATHDVAVAQRIGRTLRVASGRTEWAS